MSIRRQGVRRAAWLTLLLVSCSGDATEDEQGVAGGKAPGAAAGPTGGKPDRTPRGGDDDATEDDDAAPKIPHFVAVSFNTGTSVNNSDPEANAGFGDEQSRYSDEYYGNGVAWAPFIDATAQWLAELRPDVITFQELFYPEDCAEIPDEARTGFICETWQPGDPSVVAILLGPDYQIACHPGHSDNCAAVKTSFGKLRGCDAEFCLEGLTGFGVETCGKGARVARGTIDLAGGGVLTLVNIHATSGFSDDDQQCRIKQFEQIFIDLGDGEPAANGENNLVLGDFNTDPRRMVRSDVSSARLYELVGPGSKFHFISDVGEDVTPTYAKLFNIDHALGDTLDGACWSAGATDGHPPVMPYTAYDHKPLVCNVE